MGNLNVTSLNEKEQELVLKAEHLDIVGISSIKCRGSDIIELNEGWKLFYSGIDVTMSAQIGVGIFLSSRLAHCVTDYNSRCSNLGAQGKDFQKLMFCKKEKEL